MTRPLPLPLRNRLADLILDALHDGAARRGLEAVAAVCDDPRALEAAALPPERFPADLFERRPHGSPCAAGFGRPRAAFCERAAAPRGPSRAGRSRPRIRRGRSVLAAAAALFDAGLFFEVHELLEPYWFRAEGAEREALQGLIQVAVGFQHLANGNLEGARALLRDGAHQGGSRATRAGRPRTRARSRPRWPAPRRILPLGAEARRAVRLDPGARAFRRRRAAPDAAHLPGRRRARDRAAAQAAAAGTLRRGLARSPRAGQAWVGRGAEAPAGCRRRPAARRASRWTRRAVPVYYGPRLCDVESLPAEESLRSRVLSAHGIAVAWITLDARRAHACTSRQSPRTRSSSCGGPAATPRTSGASSGRSGRRASTWPSTTAATPRARRGPRAFPRRRWDELIARARQPQG